MKLLLLTDGIPPYVVGGMQRHSFLLAEYLAREGVEIELHHVCAAAGKKSLENLFSSDARTNIHLVEHDFPSSVKFPGHYLFNSYRLSLKIYNHIKERLSCFDFVYIKGFTGLELLRNKYRLNSCPPIGVNFHGMNMFLPTFGIKQNLEQFLLSPPTLYSLKRADFVFSYGGKVTNTIIKTGCSRNKIIEIPTGVEESWLCDQPHTAKHSLRKVLFMGRYDIVKGIRELSEALDVSDYNLEFHFIGPFEEHHQVKKQNVHYHGLIKDKDKLIEIIDEMDALILPSYSEGMPNAILESMARGLCIIATNVGANSLLVDSSNGILLENSNVNQIQDSLRAFASLSEQELINMKRKSLRKVKTAFTWTEIGNRTKKVLLQIIENRK